MSASADDTLGDGGSSGGSGRERIDLEAGAVLGRFVLLERAGRGGMGTVFAAYDPQLDRRVALKLLHSGGAASVRAEQLVREAKAMARLSHPNVVAVHDVGFVAEHVFLAMEFVAGSTLGEWMRAEPRPWRDVVEMLAQAGRGLAAAHAAGLVHGDFKPDNVIVGEDGRARVTDFGLARTVEDPAAGGGGSTMSGSSRVGTPAYMAPELHMGAPPDAASDQFAFCVALYEALHGERPFGGASATQISVEIIAGRVKSPIDDRVPAWVRQACVKGLATRPDARHPSMEVLLEVLADDPTSRRRRRIGIVALMGVASVIAAGTYAAYWNREHECDAAGSDATDVWSDEARAAIEASFDRAAAGHGREAWERVRTAIDDYVTKWSTARVDVCNRERVGALNDVAATASRECLDEALVSLAASVEVLQSADAEVVRRAVQLVAALPDPADCSDTRALLTRPVPAPDAVADAVATESQELVRVIALISGGRYTEAEAITSEMLERVRPLDYGPLVARAELQHGIVLAQLGRADEAVVFLERAYFTAGRARDFTSATEAAARLVQHEAHDLGHLETARTWQAHMEMMASLVEPRSIKLESSVHASSAALYNAEGRHEDALEAFERSRDLSLEHFGPSHYSAGFADFNMGTALTRLGRHDEAIERFQAAERSIEVSLGSQHPAVATIRMSRAFSLHQSDRAQEALDAFRGALAISEAVYGADSPHVARALDGVGIALDNLGRYDEGLEHHLRATEIFERTRDPDHIDLAIPASNAGHSLWLAGEFAAAVPYFRRALAIWEATLGPEHPQVSAVRHNLAEALRAAGQLDEAEAEHRRALEVRLRILPADHVDLAASRAGVAEVLLSRGQPQDALPLLEQAVAIAEHATLLPLARGEWRFALGRALVETGGDQARARQLAEQALEDFRAAAPLADEQSRTVERWLERQR